MNQHNWKKSIRQSRVAAQITCCEDERETKSAEYEGIGDHANPEIAATGLEQYQINSLCQRDTMFIELLPEPFEQVRLMPG